MQFPMRINHLLLFALALLMSGCPAAAPRQDSSLPAAASFSIAAPDALTVTVAGSFNRWDPGSHPLSGPDQHGRWTTTVSLPVGRYEYLFVINGSTWVLDPAAPSVDNGLGGRNSVVTVTEGAGGEK
ncbi:MAG: glycogen-binding domain-containing protein [Nitrospirota bacterium]